MGPDRTTDLKFQVHNTTVPPSASVTRKKRREWQREKERGREEKQESERQRGERKGRGRGRRKGEVRKEARGKKEGRGGWGEGGRHGGYSACLYKTSTCKRKSNSIQRTGSETRTVHLQAFSGGVRLGPVQLKAELKPYLLL